MENEIVQVERARTELAPSSPVAAAMQILEANKDFDVDKLGTVLELQMKHEANEARKSFASDFTQAQAKVAAVVKTKENKQTGSMYAGLDDVLNMVRPIYTEHGFSVIFHEGEAKDDGFIRISADVLHKSGHQEKYHADLPLDIAGIKGSTNKTQMHGKGSTFSYGRRYLSCMIWNIPTADDDGNAAGNTDSYKPLSGAKKEMMDKVFDKLLDSWPEGKKVDLDLLCRLVYERSWNYPLNDEEVGLMAKFIVENDYINSICVNKKG